MTSLVCGPLYGISLGWLSVWVKPTMDISFVQSEQPEDHQLIQKHLGVKKILICYPPIEEEGVYNGNNGPTNC
jgi:hypothetical protein